MVLHYATSEDAPFANMGDTSTNSDMWPLCLAGHTATGEFRQVSTMARGQGTRVGTPYTIRFAPHNNTYAMVSGARSVFGHYTWSLAESWVPSLSGGQNTRQARLDLGGGTSGMCVASDKNVGTFTSQLGVATFNIST